MSKELRLILRETPLGREATPWLEPQREKFARVAKECSQAFRHSKLRGAAKIRAMNAWTSNKLREEKGDSASSAGQ